MTDPEYSGSTEASEADPHGLYQLSVQNPEADIDFILEVFRSLGRPRPRRLREDFCGTAYLSRVWVEGERRRTALAVDRDLAVLAWARRRNQTPRTAKRLTLLCGDTRRLEAGPVDLVCAQNFSFFGLKTRRELRRYLETARRALSPRGLLFLELYGGTEAVVPLEERRDCDGFVYVWEQESFNPVDHSTRCHIHFELSDGSRLERAFTYDWRLWSIPEVRELLAEAGFGESLVYWEQTDDEGEGTGEFLATEKEENQEGWLVYLVGIPR